jgi:hypothetical protein
MKHDLTTGTRQEDTGCPISIVLAATSDESRYSYSTENWLTSLAPTNEESSWLNEEKNLIRVKK